MIMARFSLFNGKKKADDGHTPDKLLGKTTPFAVTEAFKKLRTNLRFTLAASDSPLANIAAVSSSLPGEGKSITSANLAISMGQIYPRILLIDADMRKPVQHKLFECSRERGLSSVLAGTETLENSLIKGVREHLDLLPAGPIPPNPAELLASKNMSKLLAEVGEYYDCVIIDTPPVDVVTDTLVFAGQIAGMVLVVRPDVCRHAVLQKTLSAAELAGIKVLGVVTSDHTGDGALTPYYKGKYYKSYSK